MDQIKNRIIAKIYDMSINFRLCLMGVNKCVVKKEDGIVYYEGGSKSNDTIVLIHGFADSKNGHLMVAKKLLFKYRVLIPDLPGFGDNTKNHQEKYSLSYMSDKVIELLNEKRLKKVHLLGNSLGGAVAMEIASKAPELVNSLILVGSAGFYRSDIRTAQNEIFEGSYIFHVNSDHEFKKLVERVFAKPPKIPRFLFDYFSKDFQAQGKWYRKLLNDLTGGIPVDNVDEKLLRTSFNSKVKDFSMSTLLLWGEEDRVFPLEIGEFASTIVPNSKLKILKNAGHAPQHENLADYMNELLVFLKESEGYNDLVGET